MRQIAIFFLTAAALMVCSCDEEAASRTGASAAVAGEGEPLVTICFKSLGRSEPAEKVRDGQEKGLVAALWADGTIIWAQKQSQGEAAYMIAAADSEKVEAMQTYLRNQVFGDTELETAYLGPDASYMEIRAVDGPRRLRMRSWHEGFEANENLVATAGGITPLQGKDRDEVLAEQPAAYRRFRDVWGEIRVRMGEMTPDSGQPYSGPLAFGQ